jgi:hypothetical protein
VIRIEAAFDALDSGRIQILSGHFLYLPESSGQLNGWIGHLFIASAPVTDWLGVVSKAGADR